MLRKVKELVILGVVIGLVALAYRDIVVREYPPVTLTLTQVTRQEALEQVTAQLGITLVDSSGESWSKYRSDFQFENTPVSDVLNRLGANWKLIGDVLIVTPVHEGLGCGAIRMEYILDEVPVRVLLPELKSGFPLVVFTPHPTMNGFYASGARYELLEIKRLIDQMDAASISGMMKRRHKIQHFRPGELRRQVESRYPLVVVQREDDGLVLEGPFPDTGQALLFLREVDRETLIIPVSLEELRQAQTTCRYFGRTSPRVDCEPNCQGPLHLLGLQVGDVLEDHYNDDLRDKPEWWVKRAERDYRIMLEIVR